MMSNQIKIAAVACALAFTGLAQAVGTWETTLLGRDINGNPVDGSSASAVFLYDTTLDVTWLRDAGMNGWISWEAAMAWADTLTVGRFGGWRLPTMIDTGAPGCQFSYVGTDCGFNVDPFSGEMAHLFQVALGNVSQFDTSGNPRGGTEGVDWGLVNKGNFLNLKADDHWYGETYALDNLLAWRYGTSNMSQYPAASTTFALAVRPGDVFAVPEPETYTLMLVGLGVVGFAARRCRGSAT